MGGAFLTERGKIVLGRGKFYNTYKPRQHMFLFHRVSNFKAYGWNSRDKKYFFKYAFANQYDVAQMLGERTVCIMLCLLCFIM